MTMEGVYDPQPRYRWFALNSTCPVPDVVTYVNMAYLVKENALSLTSQAISKVPIQMRGTGGGRCSHGFISPSTNP